MKPKTNRKGELNESKPFDRCQTPAHTFDPLKPYISKNDTIWESAAGEQTMLADTMIDAYYHVVMSDILYTPEQNFFEYQPKEWDVQVTNPPYSVKYDWMKRSYELGKPFALLIPVESLGAQKAQKLMKQYGFEIILLNKRVNFHMPNKGFDGSGAQFPVMWFTWGLNIGKQVSFYEW